jgi:hypothetical protein
MIVGLCYHSINASTLTKWSQIYTCPQSPKWKYDKKFKTQSPLLCYLLIALNILLFTQAFLK